MTPKQEKEAETDVFRKVLWDKSKDSILEEAQVAGENADLFLPGAKRQAMVDSLYDD